MRQYFQIKNEYPDALVFFQVGDFYELFFSDAQIAAEFLAITLTKRGKHNGLDIPLCGVPCHTLMHHLAKLVRGGFKVAVCDQRSKPKPGTVVERAVSRVYTPGTITDDLLLDQKKPSYILSLGRANASLGLVFAEILTSELFATELADFNTKMIENELIRFDPDEIVMPLFNGAKDLQAYFKAIGLFVSILDFEQYQQHFNQNIVDSVCQSQAVEMSLKTLGQYLVTNNKEVLEQAQSVNFYKPSSFLSMDNNAQKTLEILRNTSDGTTKNTLFSTLDQCATTAGSRTLVKWLSRPLLDFDQITMRQEFVEQLSTAPSALFAFGKALEQLPDVERIVGRIVLGRAKVFDLVNLIKTLKTIPKICSLLKIINCSIAKNFLGKIDQLDNLLELLTSSFDPETSSDSNPIKKGFDQELDRLKTMVTDTQTLICQVEEFEIKKTGIDSLKIKYNEVYGYSIEITNPNLNKVPEHYKQQQTLVGRTRFVTPELKALEQEIINAQGTIETYQQELFEKIKTSVAAQCGPLRKNAVALAQLDALFGLAKAAYKNRYVRPRIDQTGYDLEIVQGRHPVIEQTVKFVANDLHLTEQTSTWIITGPNMGGKSTFLRQCAQICIMAQCGSFVPAKSANLAIVDKIFTRIGSGDNLAAGKSTFLVEMEEVASICSNATKNSFLILDEVGRGTGTYDGIAIAQAFLEFVRDSVKAKCLFATHYQELTALESSPGIANYHARAERTSDSLVFLHKIELGRALGSFGIDVAKMAGFPDQVVKRANEILKGLVE